MSTVISSERQEHLSLMNGKKPIVLTCAIVNAVGPPASKNMERRKMGSSKMATRVPSVSDAKIA